MEGTLSEPLYYDPWNVEIDLDPYPTYRRLRDEAAAVLQRAPRLLGFSRYADVDAAFEARQAQLGQRRHPGSSQGRPGHAARGIHQRRSAAAHHPSRPGLAGLHRPSKCGRLEDKVRTFCVACLDPISAVDRFDFVMIWGRAADAHHRHAGRHPRFRPALRSRHAHRVLRNEPGKPLPVKKNHYFDGDMFTDYVAWRRKTPPTI